MRGLLEKLSWRPPRGEEPPVGDGMPQVQRRKTYALPLVPVVIVAITTGRTAAELDRVARRSPNGSVRRSSRETVRNPWWLVRLPSRREPATRVHPARSGGYRKRWWTRSRTPEDGDR